MSLDNLGKTLGWMLTARDVLDSDLDPQAKSKAIEDTIVRTPEALFSFTKEEQENYYDAIASAIKRNPLVWSGLDLDMRKDHTLTLYAVQGDPNILENLSEDFKKENPDICIAGMRQDPRVTRYVPREVLDENVKAIEDIARENICISYTLPKDFLEQNPQITKIAQESFLEQIAPHLEKIKNDPNAIKDVPRELLVEEFYKKAVEENPYAIQFVSWLILTNEMCENAVSRDGRVLQYIDYQYVTPELCTIAVNQNSEAIKYVPEYILEEHPEIKDCLNTETKEILGLVEKTISPDTDNSSDKGSELDNNE